jgi:hypothetical protein
MSDERSKLTDEEIAAQEGEGLPPREVMSLIEPSFDGTGPVWTLPVEPVDPSTDPVQPDGNEIA